MCVTYTRRFLEKRFNLSLVGEMHGNGQIDKYVAPQLCVVAANCARLKATALFSNAIPANFIFYHYCKFCEVLSF